MIKTQIFNKLMKNGSKQTSEKVLFKSIKKIQKLSHKKNFEDIIKLGLINSSPIIYIKTIRRKRKQTVEFPFLLKNRARIFYGLTSILTTCRLKQKLTFYKLLNLELFNSAKNNSKSVEKKLKIHQQSFLKKKFANYRWF